MNLGDRPRPDEPVTNGVARAAALQQLAIQSRFADTADVNRDEAVIMAHRFGATWAEIGGACGITRQAAHRRYAHLIGRDEP